MVIIFNDLLFQGNNELERTLIFSWTTNSLSTSGRFDSKNATFYFCEYDRQVEGQPYIHGDIIASIIKKIV